MHLFLGGRKINGVRVYSFFFNLTRFVVFVVFVAFSSATGRQAFLYFPILLVARVSWVLQSFLFVFNALPGAGLWATKGEDTARANSKSLANKLEVREFRHKLLKQMKGGKEGRVERCVTLV